MNTVCYTVCMPRPKPTLEGRTFGRLTAVTYTNYAKGWQCSCACGKRVWVATANLTSGRQQSCGCLKREATKTRMTTHGGCGTPEHTIWRSMKQRCLDKNHRAYRLYGARGIAICSQWLDFRVFLQDMGKRPSPRHSLDRIDNDGPYAPENCRWATSTQQVSNRRVTVKLSHNGQTRTMREWAAITGISYGTLLSRRHYGWSDARILTEPIGAAGRPSWTGAGPSTPAR